MTRPAKSSSTESQVELLYSQQARLYAEFLEWAEKLPQEFAASRVGDEVVAHMNRLMDQIQQLDRQSQSLRMAWKHEGSPAGPRLAGLLKQVEQLIVQLMQRIDVAENAAQQAKSRLLPQLSTESRRAQMTRAYQAVAGQSVPDATCPTT